jgi:hypothetical protein
VTIGPVRAAKHAGASAIQPGTDRAVTIGGKPTVTIAQGADVVTDPVEFPVAALEQLAISLYVVDSGKASTLHGVGMQTAYIANGDVTAATKLAESETDTSRYFLTDVEVAAGADARTLVVVGDSMVSARRSMPTGAGRTHWPNACAPTRRSRRSLSSIQVLRAIGS